MEIQQHDGVVVETMEISARLRQAQGDGGVTACPGTSATPLAGTNPLHRKL